MSLRAKVLLIITAVFICAMGLVYAVSRLIFIEGLKEIEEQNTTTQVEQAAGVLTYLVNGLETDTADWAAWDDTYEFIEDTNEDYIDSNLVDETFVTLKICAMLFIDTGGNVVYSKSSDPVTGEEIPVSQDLLDNFSGNSPFLSNHGGEGIFSGLVKIDNEPVLVAAQPILTSENEGPARGTLVFCRLLNDDTISELAGIFQFPISVFPVNNPGSVDVQQALNELRSGLRITVFPLNGETVAGYTIIDDLYGDPAFVLRVSALRETYRLGERVSLFYILAILSVGALVWIFAWFLLQTRVLSRVMLLIRGVNRIAESGDSSIRIALTGRDEVSMIAGTIDGMLGALEEVGKEIRESENRYRLLADNVMDVIWSTDRHFNITYVSPSVVQLTGYTVEEMIQRPLSSLLEDSEMAKTMESAADDYDSLAGDMLDGSAFEIPITRKDHAKIWIEVRFSPIRDNNKQIVGFVGVARDIVERRQAEELYRTLANSSTVGVYIYQDGLFRFVNPRFQELIGLPEEELLGMNPREIVEPDDRREARQNAILMLKGKLHSPYEFRVLHPSGETHWAMETVSSIEYNGKPATLGNFMDITESKLARDELEKLYAEERRLRQSLETEIQKRIEFTRALVHELKTPITPVLAAVELLMEEMKDDRLMRLVQSIDRSASNLNQRIDELLDLARGETAMLSIETESVDILSLLNDIHYEMTPLANRNQQELEFVLPESLPYIEADKGRLRQVILNLLNNAFKFTPEGGKITLKAGVSGESVLFEVNDTGSGIAAEDLERLFEPYFRRTTDRERLSGLGLGLALAKSFVELHGGKIWVESESGKGSVFRFTIPIKHEGSDE